MSQLTESNWELSKACSYRVGAGFGGWVGEVKAGMVLVERRELVPNTSKRGLLRAELQSISLDCLTVVLLKMIGEQRTGSEISQSPNLREM